MEICLEDESIHIDISSTASPHCKESEFEFQTQVDPVEKETTSYPADELFYNGKLLPLHLSPRIHVIQNLLEENVIDAITISQKYPLHESCKMSTVDSCHVDGGYTNDVTMRSWCTTLKLLQQKSKPHLNSLLTTKSKCADPNVRNTMKSTNTFKEKATYRKSFSGAIHYEMKTKFSSNVITLLFFVIVFIFKCKFIPFFKRGN